MLFSFNYFWKLLLMLLGSWLFYGLWGFEFTIITQLSVLTAFYLKDDSLVI
tara:strand:- start:191 stop:343 length:153 start_codon:yes stop_codon:yes gene_type:complete